MDFLKTGITSASFKCWGNIPFFIEELKSTTILGHMTSLISLIMRAGKDSIGDDLDVSNFRTSFCTDFRLVRLKENVEISG